MVQEEALTSFALYIYDFYHTNNVHKQLLASEIRSRVEYLITTQRTKNNLILLVGLNTI